MRSTMPLSLSLDCLVSGVPREVDLNKGIVRPTTTQPQVAQINIQSAREASERVC